MDSNIRYRYSYSGSGWSVRSIDPQKTERNKDARRTRPVALLVVASTLICLVVAGLTIFSRRAPQFEQPSASEKSEQDFIVSAPVLHPDKVGFIPGLPRLAPASPEPEAPSEVSRPEPQQPETVDPGPRTAPPATIDAGRAHRDVTVRRAAQRPREARGQVGQIVLSTGSGNAQSASINSPIVVEPGQQKRVVLYTELRDLAGETAFHRWQHRGRTMAVIPFKVGADRWRVHSSKTLTPALKGPWQVVVTDSRGAILASRSFVVR